MTIAGPGRSGALANVTLNVVEALELDPPQGEAPIRWGLFTTLPISTLDDLVDVLDG